MIWPHKAPYNVLKCVLGRPGTQTPTEHGQGSGELQLCSTRASRGHSTPGPPQGLPRASRKSTTTSGQGSLERSSEGSVVFQVNHKTPDTTDRSPGATLPQSAFKWLCPCQESPFSRPVHPMPAHPPTPTPTPALPSFTPSLPSVCRGRLRVGSCYGLSVLSFRGFIQIAVCLPHLKDRDVFFIHF